MKIDAAVESMLLLGSAISLHIWITAGCSMTQVEAIYQNGVFRPLQDVGLPENQRVRLSVQPFEARDIQAWLEGVQQLQQHIIAQRGYFPDSAVEIAEDRRR